MLVGRLLVVLGKLYLVFWLQQSPVLLTALLYSVLLLALIQSYKKSCYLFTEKSDHT